jgi:hypothetical protein
MFRVIFHFGISNGIRGFGILVSAFGELGFGLYTLYVGLHCIFPDLIFFHLAYLLLVCQNYKKLCGVSNQNERKFKIELHQIEILV